MAVASNGSALRYCTARVRGVKSVVLAAAASGGDSLYCPGHRGAFKRP